MDADKIRKTFSIEKSKVLDIIAGVDPDYRVVKSGVFRTFSEEKENWIVQPAGQELFYRVERKEWSNEISSGCDWDNLKEIEFTEVFKKVQVYYE